MGRHKIYLGGPIGGLTHDECTKWRDYVIKAIDPRIDVYCPLRGKSFLEAEGVLGCQGYQHPMASQEGVMARDYNDTKRADALLVNLKGATRPSFGTVMEVAWSYAMQKPVIMVREEGNLHEHLMIDEACSYIVDELDTAIVLAEALLLPDTGR